MINAFRFGPDGGGLRARIAAFHPYAGTTRIRFEGFRLSAISALAGTPGNKC